MAVDDSCPVVSVIMPVHNAERYLKYSVNSVLKQTLGEFELICINDSSTDSSLAILEAFAADDDRVKILSHDGNAGSARNCGMSEAQGQYLIFLDSDDFFEVTLLEETVAAAQLHDADMVLFGGFRFDDALQESSKDLQFLDSGKLPDKKVFTYKDLQDDIFQVINPAPWTRLYSREFVAHTGYEFQSIDNANDWFFSYATLIAARRICVVEKGLVYYRTNTLSSVQSRKEKAPLCFLEAIFALYEEAERLGVLGEIRKSLDYAALSSTRFNLQTLSAAEARFEVLDALESARFEGLGLLGQNARSYKASFVRDVAGFISTAVEQRRKRRAAPSQNRTLKVLQDASQRKLPKVSVIVPVFNTAGYLEEAITSITSQTLRNIEIICIDDGSTDESLRTMQRLARQDNRIRLFAQPNSGLSCTRNQGMSLAKGEYLYFFDSDDWLDADALKRLCACADAAGFDMLMFDAVPFYEEGDLVEVNKTYSDYYHRRGGYEGAYEGPSLMGQMARCGDYLQSACLYLLRSSFVQSQKLAFHEGILHEDNAFTFSALLGAKKAGYMSEKFYRRRVRHGSITRAVPTFDHCYGYFACYLDMAALHSASAERLSGRQYAETLPVVMECLSSARAAFRKMPEKERGGQLALADREEALFEELVAKPAIKDLEAEALRCEIGDFYHSPSYRLGRALTWPLRQASYLIKSIKDKGAI